MRPVTLEVRVHDSFAEYIGGPPEVVTFSLSVHDAGRLAGHLCPTVAGTFIAVRAAVLALFPESGVCERGLLRVELAGGPTEGVNGPIGHVISYVTGAWGEDGFPGIRGSHVRKGLLRFNSNRVEPGTIRFERRDNGMAVEVLLHPERAKATPGRSSVETMLHSADQIVEVRTVEGLGLKP